MDFPAIFHCRYSCRSFSPRSVEREAIDQILEAGRIAPTAVNKQPVHVWAITDPGALKAIKNTTRSNFGAPLLLTVGYHTGDSKPSPMHGVRKPMGEFVSMIE